MIRPLFAAVATTLVAGLAVSQSNAATVVFDLRNAAGTAISGKSSTTYAQGGLTGTFTARLDGATNAATLLNRTASNFGINAVGVGDVTDQIDGGLGVESILISFDQAVTLDSLVLSSFTSTERAILTLPSGSQTISTNTYAPTGNSLAAGESFSLAWSVGNGFSFDSFQVTTTGASTVPLPPAVAGGVACLAAFGLRRIRRGA